MTDTDRENKIASCFGQGVDPHEAFREFEDEGKGYGEQDDDHNAEEVAASWQDVAEEDAYGVGTDYIVYDRDAIDSLDN